MYRRSVLVQKIGFLLIPILGIPLLFFGKEYLCIYTIWVAGAYIGTNWIPMAIASLLPVFFFPIFHIISAQDVSINYFRDVGVLFTATLIMAMAVEETRLHSRIALGLLRISGAKKQYILINFMLATTFISFFLSDAAATALMIPIAIAIIQTIQSVRNDSQKRKDGEKPINWDNFTEEDKGFGKALLLAASHCSAIGGTAIVTASPANLLLNDQMQYFYSDYNGITYTQWLAYAMPTQPFLLIIDYIVLVWCFMGFKHLFFWRNTPAKTVKKIYPLGLSGSSLEAYPTGDGEEESSKNVVDTIRQSYVDLGPITFGEGSLLFWFSILTLSWIFRRPGFMPGWGELFPDGYISDSTIGILVASLMFIWPKDPRNDPKLSPILTWDIMKQKFAWQILLFIGQSSALAHGVKKSGLGNLSSCSISRIFGEDSPFLLQVFAYIITLIARELFGVSAVFIGIFLSISQNFGLHPLYIGIPVTLILSFGYMSRTNVMNMLVLETKLITIRDTMYTGIFLNLATMFLVLLNMNTYAYWVLDLAHPPSSIPSTLNCSVYY